MFPKAVKYMNNGRPDKALALFKKLEPFKEVLCNMGTCYRELGNDTLAEQCYIKALDPKVPLTDHSFMDDFPIARSNLGLIHYTYERDDEAIQCYMQALKDNPVYYDALWNMANSLLRKCCSHKSDNFKLAWDMYNFRYYRNKPVTLKSKKKVVQWDGSPCDSVIIMTEQGFGDQLMFARYLPLVRERVKRVIVQCHPSLKPLYSDYETCEDPIETDVDVGLGICGLGKVFNDVIPNGEWLSHLYTPKVKNGVLDIGCTWSGNKHHVNDKYRSTTPNYFRDLPGNKYTLNPSEKGTRGFTHLDGSWIDNIRDMSKLDLVITVDTSIAHLCGSLGMPCWVLMPLKNCDFRWGDSSMGESNIWYPSVRVFRNPGSWDKVFEKVKNEIDKYSVR